MRWKSVTVMAVLLATGAARGDTLITAPALVNRTPGADFHLGTADDGSASTSVGPRQSGANARGAASYLLLKEDGSIPANGNDYDYIIFFDGSLELTLDTAASTAESAVMHIVGGTMQTTPEFTPGRTGGTLSALSGTITFGVNDGSAAAELSGQFDDPAFTTAIMNQTANAAPGMSTIVMRSGFGASGSAYVDDILTPLVPTDAGQIALLEFTGTVTGVVACCSNFGMRGVFALYRTEGSPGGGGGGGPCATIDECGAGLHDALPPIDNADPKLRKVAVKLAKLAEAAKAKVEQTAGAPDKKAARLRKSARSKLKKLLAQARQADRKGRLGVSLATLEAAVDALLAQIPV